jgi:peptidoglycan/xylan/chitin deacetylase (PgdA/CDA1 family)
MELTIARAPGASSRIITHFSDDKRIALTFDACERGKVVHFDKKLLDFIIANKIPVSIFLSGEFVKSNRTEIEKLKAYPFIEFENHSLHHFKDMRKLSDAKVNKEIAENEKIVAGITGKKPRYFRFPGGNCDERTIKLVNAQGLKVVHWTYASGDPDKHVSSKNLVDDALARTKGGDILIFHINGRGVHTADAIPQIYKGLQEKGFVFAKLDQVVK